MNYSMFLTEESKYIQKVFSTMISPYIFNFSLKLVFYLRFIDFLKNIMFHPLTLTNICSTI
jgi:hypothetical protein